MELSILCGVKVYMFLYDLHETKVIHYQSEKSDNVNAIFKKNVHKEIFTNNDVFLIRFLHIYFDCYSMTKCGVSLLESLMKV